MLLDPPGILVKVHQLLIDNRSGENIGSRRQDRSELLQRRLQRRQRRLAPLDRRRRLEQVVNQGNQFRGQRVGHLAAQERPPGVLLGEDLIPLPTHPMNDVDVGVVAFGRC